MVDVVRFQIYEVGAEVSIEMFTECASNTGTDKQRGIAPRT
ncbi:hypothetical protein VIBR0546_18391 [Vibrio brasiliensis LMG 20546]|uniref:Uncharacterized protein n=1 Tax=Vibrio brasiliensis LMG 20546 TaxID=945543 RepID=E8LPZ3_9VIBR|nr:hypothetical protein VIBR0546_18391 [Vibrio brasiliensis LMG 20546]